MSVHIASAARTVAPFHVVPAQPTNYCPIPQRLITDLHDTPLAIGLYILVGRLFLIIQTPVPLSVPDVIRYDPTLSRGAVIRAFNRLTDGGWLIATTERGRKTSYVPTWGRVSNNPLPWSMDRSCLGRPRHIRRLPISRTLLDVCMGKLTPHPIQTAPITRYVTTPVLSLTDVGSYALTLAGLPHNTPALCRLSVVHNGLAYPLPSEKQLLAVISQWALSLDGTKTGQQVVELTISGSRRLGLIPLKSPDGVHAESQPLFFIPPGLIGSVIGPMIGSMIGEESDDDQPQTAAASAETGSADRLDRITWETRDKPDSGSLPHPPSVVEQVSAGCGGANRQEEQQRTTRRAGRGTAQARQVIPVIPDTEASRMLKTIHVLPEQLIELANLPSAAVEAAIADGKARDGIRDLAGWVVKLLRNHRDYGWHIPTPRLRSDSPAALQAVFADYAAQQATEPDCVTDTSPVPEQASAPSACETPNEIVRLWNDVSAILRMQTPRQEFNTWLRYATLHAVEQGVATIAVTNVQVKEAIERRYLAAMRDLFHQQLGVPIDVRVVLNLTAPTNASESAMSSSRPAQPPVIRAAEQADRPEWIDPERWLALPALLRAALIGSTLTDGQVRARSPHLNQFVHMRYSFELDALIMSSPASTPSEQL